MPRKYNKTPLNAAEISLLAWHIEQSLEAFPLTPDCKARNGFALTEPWEKDFRLRVKADPIFTTYRSAKFVLGQCITGDLISYLVEAHDTNRHQVAKERPSE